jgi:hypothetical protein
MNFIARELEYLQEGLTALQRSIVRGETDEAKFIIDNLLIGTARLIETCKIQRKPQLTMPETDGRSGRL